LGHERTNAIGAWQLGQQGISGASSSDILRR
jgi:hypothetical protein